jgi:hypothetical protein
MRHRSLFKYYADRRWAEAFLSGKLLFRSLAYFRDFEDKDIRGDQNEGTAVYRPEGGLIINNRTHQTTFTLPSYAFESSAKPAEIFVFCLSRSLTDELRQEFQAVACVEILDIPIFCTRIQAALPRDAKYPGSPGRTRIGWRVEYYQESEGGNPRWALPDKIATAKSARYTRQDEFRLVFSLTDALAFQNVNTRLTPSITRRVPNPAEHHSYYVDAQTLANICVLHEFPPVR